MTKNGFTLIEMMIAIAIIGILIAIIVPVFNTSKNSDGSICKYGMKYDSNHKQIIGPSGGGIPCGGPSMSPVGPNTIGKIN